MTKPKVDLAALEQQVGELTEALQRERADATNIRRRHDEQLASLQTAAKAQVVRQLLPVIDNFERALKYQVPIHANGKDTGKDAEEVAKSWVKWAEGIQGIVKQFEKTLADLGVQKIKTVGEVFNPHLHEAVSMEEGDGDTEIVSEELQSGYQLGDEVLRHAMVRVKS